MWISAAPTTYVTSGLSCNMVRTSSYQKKKKKKIPSAGFSRQRSCHHWANVERSPSRHCSQAARVQGKPPGYTVSRPLASSRKKAQHLKGTPRQAHDTARWRTTCDGYTMYKACPATCRATAHAGKQPA